MAVSTERVSGASPTQPLGLGDPLVSQRSIALRTRFSFESERYVPTHISEEAGQQANLLANAYKGAYGRPCRQSKGFLHEGVGPTRVVGFARLEEQA